MVLFFANKGTELPKTKLMKLLCYSDMMFYKENGISMSGTEYAHLPYGPVPNNIDLIIGRMESENIAHIDVLCYGDGYEKHRVIPDREVPQGVLSEAETKMLERIYHKFKDYGSGEISEYSHKEKGYKATKNGEIISYSYAMHIQLD